MMNVWTTGVNAPGYAHEWRNGKWEVAYFAPKPCDPIPGVADCPAYATPRPTDAATDALRAAAVSAIQRDDIEAARTLLDAIHTLRLGR